MKEELSNANTQAVLITGVSTGIGLGMAKKLLAEGCRVFGSVRSSNAAHELQAMLGNNFTPLIFDLSSSEQINRAKEALISSLSGQHLDAIINNAGIAEIGPLLHVTPESLTRHLDILVTGQLRVIQAFTPLLSSQPVPGRIFNISSISGKWPNVFFGNYTAGKHALEGLSKTLRLELERDNIKVIVIAPGNIATSIWTKQTMELVEQYKGTDYYRALKARLNGIQHNMADEAMTVEEFSTLFYDIYQNPNPANRYTIMKCRKWRYPFSKLTKMKTRVLVG